MERQVADAVEALMQVRDRVEQVVAAWVTVRICKANNDTTDCGSCGRHGGRAMLAFGFCGYPERNCVIRTLLSYG